VKTRQKSGKRRLFSDGFSRKMGPHGPRAQKTDCPKEKVKSVKKRENGFSEKWLSRFG